MRKLSVLRMLFEEVTLKRLELSEDDRLRKLSELRIWFDVARMLELSIGADNWILKQELFIVDKVEGARRLELSIGLGN